MGALLWSYLGWRRFPRELSGFELRRFFALEASDRRELRVRYPRRLRLGAAIQLGFVRMTGTTLDALGYVPKSLMEYVAHQLMRPAPERATLRALYRNERTRFAHQAWACAHADLRWPEHTDVAAVAETLTAAAAVTLDRQRLARQAREALFARDCLIPAGRDIDDWVRRADRVRPVPSPPDERQRARRQQLVGVDRVTRNRAGAGRGKRSRAHKQRNPITGSEVESWTGVRDEIGHV